MLLAVLRSAKEHLRQTRWSPQKGAPRASAYRAFQEAATAHIMLINNCITLWHPEKHGLISFKKATRAETWESNLNCKKTSLNSPVRCTKCKYLQEHERVLNIQSFHYFHTVHVDIMLYSSVLTLCLSVLVSLLLQIDKERWIDTSMRFLFSPDFWKHVQTIANWGKNNKPYQTCKDDIASGDRSKWSSRSRVVMSLEVLPRFVVHPGGVFYKNLERPS